MADKKDGLDIAVVMGGPKGSPVADKEPPKDDEDSGLPPEYVAAFNDFKLSNTAETFWEAVKACVEAGKEMPKGMGY